MSETFIIGSVIRKKKKGIQRWFREGSFLSSAYQLSRLWRRRGVFEESLSEKSSLERENGSVSAACLLFSQRPKT